MGTVSFEVPGPGTYEVTCDPKLDPLPGGGTAGDILAGKQFYNDQNAPVTGTMPNNPPQQVSVSPGDSYTIPKGYHDGTGKVTGTGTVLPTLTDPAGAGDILSGKDAINQSGGVLTGTMPNNGAVNVELAAGGSYTVPAGYHNGSGKVTSTSSPLPSLTNPGTAADLLKDKELIDQTGNVVTGTLEPVDTSDATATAGDILSPKTAYTASGKVTGTISTKGDSDVTADGPSVAVPPGYYPQAVNKTVSDPDLLPANIKAGVDIFGVTGTLASQFAAVLVVTVDSGATVTATDGTTTLTEVSTGTATFHLPNGGTWTVSATLNGSQATPANVEVQENFSVALSAGASQTVTVPTQYEAELSFNTSRLPEGYTEVQYVQIGNYSSIYSGIGIDTVESRVEVDFTPLEKTAYSRFIFYASGGTSTSFYTIMSLRQNNVANEMAYMSGYQLKGGSSSAGFGTFSYNMEKDKRITVIFDAKEKKVTIGGTSFSISPAYTGDTSGLLFGGYITNSSVISLTMKIHGAKIYTNNVLKGEFIPCVNPESEAGLYDSVNKAFRGAYAGTITPGPAV